MEDTNKQILVFSYPVFTSFFILHEKQILKQATPVNHQIKIHLAKITFKNDPTSVSPGSKLQ